MEDNKVIEAEIVEEKIEEKVEEKKPSHYCRSCGNELDPHLFYCRHCGVSNPWYVDAQPSTNAAELYAGENVMNPPVPKKDAHFKVLLIVALLFSLFIPIVTYVCAIIGIILAAIDKNLTKRQKISNYVLGGVICLCELIIVIESVRSTIADLQSSQAAVYALLFPLLSLF